MTTAIAAPPKPKSRDLAALADLMLALEPGRQVTISPVGWAAYDYLLEVREQAAQRGPRLTYQRGVLTIMTTSGLHESLKKVMALLIESWIDETGGKCTPRGSLTIRREDLDRGFEPDECYYIQNWSRVFGRHEIDFSIDTPPDLVIEIEVSRSAVDRLPIMAAFKVPEVWRYDGERLIALLLQSNATYAESPTSRALPALSLTELVRFLQMSTTTDYLAIGRQFRAWVRSTLSTPAQTN